MESTVLEYYITYSNEVKRLTIIGLTEFENLLSENMVQALSSI